ncbi:GH36-type glycosyl hydrolase domain-containing protein [Chloroflexota bacterium]
MKYGYFDEKNKEYIITNPKTPTKWINYIGTLEFGGFVDHTGGALLCKGDPATNRLTKYIPQLPASDFRATTLYVRFKCDYEYVIFSPFFTPSLDKYDLYECHVGMGYTRIISEFYGIHSEVTIFIPAGGQVEIRDIWILNISKSPKEIDLIPVVEYSHFDALKQFTNADWIPQTMQSKVVQAENGKKILVQYPFMMRDIRHNFFTSNIPASSFDTDRKLFLGDNEYGSWRLPLSLLQPELNNSEAVRGDNIAALMHHLGTIQPGENKQVIVQFGQTDQIHDLDTVIAKYQDPATINSALDDLNDFWEDYTSKFIVTTPNMSMDQMLNVHNPRQCYITKNWSRYLSLYQLGLGARGIGFRDSSQDVLGILPQIPEEGKILMRKLLAVQNRNGSAMHQFNPISMIASGGDSGEEEDRPDFYSDDHLWIILAVTEYLKETGDTEFLYEEIPFYEKDKNENPLETSTVLEHLQRGIEFTRNNLGDHGLPLLGFADWNDSVNLRTGAESVFTANLYGRALLAMIELYQHLSMVVNAQHFENYYDEMRQRVNIEAWDGEWYIRYFDADGSKLGSKENREGKIYSNAQSWAVLSEFAPPDRAQKSLDAVYQHLNTSNGIKLSAPGFDGYDPNKGGVSTYPPSTKENGGIFLHANPWVMIAETMVGNGDRAFEYYNQINPAAKNDKIDEFESEPYVYPQNILADEHPQFGLGRNSWLSGTASWSYQAATKYILGIRPTYQGLLIDPCIPKDWLGFKATRHFRGATYKIEVKNPNNISKGITTIKVDETKISGNIIPLYKDGKIHKVQVVLG